MRAYNDYTGKKVFIGIDVHKKTYAVACMCDETIVKKDTMPAKVDGLINYIKSRFSGAEIETAYEAGFSGFHLHRCLAAEGIKNSVIHPGSIEVASRDRVKTDKRDAKKIAVQLAVGRLNSVYIPSLEQEAKRCASRLRDNLVRLRQKIGHKIKSLLFTQGLIDGEDNTVLNKKWLHKKLDQVEQLNFPTGYFYTLKQYADQWLRLTEDLKKVSKELLEMQTEKERALLALYKSVPGVGDITALKLKDELGDMRHFLNERKLFNYIGFTPVEYSSGEHVRQGHISRQSRAVLRHMFVESAWVAIKKDPQLKEIYGRLAKSRGARKAIVGVARRLAGRIRSCVQNGVLYEIKILQTENVENDKKPIVRDPVVLLVDCTQ